MKLLILFLCIILELPLFIHTLVEDRQICDCSTAYSSWISEIVKPFLTKPTQVAALGRVARIGDFYDARSDHFMELSLYPSGLPGDAISSIDNAYSSVDYIKAETFLEKFRKLGVQTSLFISFLGGLVSVSGSGNYLNQDKKSAKSAKASLVYRHKIRSEHLQIFSKSSKSAFDTFLLKNVDATHVVVGIEWGANVVLSLEETNTDLTNYKDVQRKLEKVIDEIVLSVINSSHVNSERFDFEKNGTFSVDFNADIVSNTVPQMIKPSITYLRDIRNLIKTQNGGKGKIVNYILMPVQTVRKLFEVKSNTTGIVNEMDPEIIDQFLAIFQELKDSKLLIKDACDLFNIWNLMVPKKELAEVIDFNRKLFSFENMFKKRFADLVVLFRSGKFYDGALGELVSAYERSDYTLGSVKKFLDGYEPTMNKIELLNLLQSLNVSFMNRKTDQYKLIEMSYLQNISFISADLSNVLSPFVNDLIKSVNAELKRQKEAIKYYIEDVPIRIPEVKMYSEGNIIQSCSYNKEWSPCFYDVVKNRKIEKKYSIGRKEYIFLRIIGGTVLIVDSNILKQIKKYYITEIANSLIAIINGTFYNLDTTKGTITSTAIENIFNGQSAVNWTHVGSFPSEDKPKYDGVAVENSFIYFLTYSGVLYLYDTKLKTVSKKATILEKDYYSSLVVVDGILYIHISSKFYSFDGTAVGEITTPENRFHCGLFKLGSLVCRVGGNTTDIGLNPDPVSCFNPVNDTWTVTSYINHYRRSPGITSTKSGIYIFGGISWWNPVSYGVLDSVEVLQPMSKIWSTVKSPFSDHLSYTQAVTFYY